MNTFYAGGEPIKTYVEDYFKTYLPDWKQVYDFPAKLVFVHREASYGKNMKNTKKSEMLSILDGSTKEIITNKILFGTIYIKEPFIPKFHIIYHKHDLEKLLETEGYLKNAKILKPLGTYSGAGIIVSDNKKDLLDHKESVSKPTAWVIQDYIKHPSLFKGFKFHIRVHIIPIRRSYDGPIEIYVTTINRMILASKPYKPSDWLNEDIHDTHLRRNPRNPFFPIDFPDGWSKEDVDQAQTKIINILKKIFTDYHDLSPAWGAKGGFDLFGADVLFDSETKNPYILEINSKITFHPSQKNIIFSIMNLVLENKVDCNLVKIYDERTTIVKTNKKYNYGLFVNDMTLSYININSLKCPYADYILTVGSLKVNPQYEKTYKPKTLSSNGKKMEFLFDQIVKAKPFAKINYVKNSGITDKLTKKEQYNPKVLEYLDPITFKKSSLERINEWIEKTSGKRVIFLSLTYGLSQVNMPFAPQFLWKDSDHERFWEHVDKSISRTKTNISFKDLIQTYYSIYKNTNENPKPFSYFDDLTVEDYIEYFYGGIERVKMLKELFQKFEKNDIKVVFITSNWTVYTSPKLWEEIVPVFIPSKNYEIHYVGWEIDWNKILKVYMLGYGSLCKTEKTQTLKHKIDNKTKTRKNRKKMI
jgi:hypothetical protein